jgi:hypothetical protein
VLPRLARQIGRDVYDLRVTHHDRIELRRWLRAWSPNGNQCAETAARAACDLLRRHAMQPHSTTNKSRSRGPSRATKPASRKRYGGKASEKVERAMHEMKRGELRSGGSGKKVTSRKQAIAIGLSEARRAGGKVPAAPSRKKASRKKAA